MRKIPDLNTEAPKQKRKTRAERLATLKSTAAQIKLGLGIRAGFRRVFANVSKALANVWKVLIRVWQSVANVRRWLPGTLRALASAALAAALLFAVYGLEVQSAPEYDPMLNVAFVGTAGEADCIALWQNDFAVMIDTGEERDAQTILDFLKTNDIRRLNYLILTHPDKDHIGSASEIIRNLPVDTVIQPYYEKQSIPVQQLLMRVNEYKVRAVYPSRVMHYKIHDLSFFIYPPQQKNYGNDNNYSLAVIVQHRNVNMFFPGDALDKRFAELEGVDLPPVQLYKLPHHGRYGGYSEVYLERLHPEIGVVTARGADERLTETGKEMGTEFYYTVNHTVQFVSDGETLMEVESDK